MSPVLESPLLETPLLETRSLEAFYGDTEAECHALVETIRQVREEGVSIIWIEHIVHALISVVDRLIVIDFGALLAEGDPERVMADPKVREVYMGIPAA